MIERKVTQADAGGRLDKYLSKLLKEAPLSFIYKMLRKKNIVLNGKKAAGNEILKPEDSVKLFLSEETILKFGGSPGTTVKAQREYEIKEEDLSSEVEGSLYERMKNFRWEEELPVILYEDEDILILNKPANVLSQGAREGEISLNDWILQYLIRKGSLTEETILTVRPSVVNRLDRNTSGIILAGKTLRGLRFLSDLLRDKTLEKYYLTVVKGNFKEEVTEEAYLVKDRSHNTVKISKENTEGAFPIKTAFYPLSFAAGHSLLKVRLITGKSHQIRAHLSFLGYPVAGDTKYGLRSDQVFYRRLGLKSQFLHSYSLRFPKLTGPFSHLSERIFYAPLSKHYVSVLKKLEMNDAVMEFQRA